MFWTIYLFTIVIYGMLILLGLQDKETAETVEKEITCNSAWLITIIPVLNTVVLLAAIVKTLYSRLK